MPDLAERTVSVKTQKIQLLSAGSIDKCTSLAYQFSSSVAVQ